MKEFIHSVYDNPNFPLYLGIIIIVLLIAFFVVFFMGKKDQDKLDETKKLDTIDKNAFEETSKPVNLELAKEKEETVSLGEVPKEDIPPEIKTPSEDEGYVAKPIINEDVEPPISMPEVDKSSEEIPQENNETNNASVVNEVFSSVYAPKKDPVLFDDTAEIELPKLK